MILPGSTARDGTILTFEPSCLGHVGRYDRVIRPCPVEGTSHLRLDGRRDGIVCQVYHRVEHAVVQNVGCGHVIQALAGSYPRPGLLNIDLLVRQKVT